jgi:hypothetical protein
MLVCTAALAVATAACVSVPVSDEMMAGMDTHHLIEVAIGLAAIIDGSVALWWIRKRA